MAFAVLVTYKLLSNNMWRQVCLPGDIQLKYRMSIPNMLPLAISYYQPRGAYLVAYRNVYI